MTECEGKLVTDILEGLALEKHQIELLTRIGVIDENDVNFNEDSLVGRLKCVCDALGVLNAVDFATESTLEQARQLLVQIEENTDELEIKIDSVNINTDEIEEKLDELKLVVENFKLQSQNESDETQSILGEVSVTPTENTIQDRLKKIKDSLDVVSDGTTNTDLLNKLNDILSEIDLFATAFDNRDLATETTLEAARLLLVQIEENTDSLELNTDELELKLDQLKASVEGFNTAFDNRDLATETTLLAFKNEAKVESDETQSILGEVSATPTENTIQDRLKKIKDCLDTISDGTTNTDLLNKLDQILNEIDLFATAFDNRDLATENTLSAFKVQSKNESDETQSLIGEVSATPTANTVMDRLKSIFEAVDDLELSVDNIDINTDEIEQKLDTLNTNLVAFNTAFDNRDLATETTLSAFKTAFDNEDFATEATLDAAKDILSDILLTAQAIDGNTDEVEDKLDLLKTCLDVFKASFESILGEVDANPTVNTVLDRLKQIKDALDVISDGTTNTDILNKLQEILLEIDAFNTAFDNRDLATETTLLAFKNEVKAESDETQALIGEVSATPTTNTVLGRLKDIWQAISDTNTQAWVQIFKHATPVDNSLSSGSDFVIDPILNSESNAIDSGWIQITESNNNHKVNQEITVKSDVDLVLHVMNATDASGNNITGNTTGESVSIIAGVPRVIVSNFFTSHFRIVVKNVSGSTANNLSIASYGGTASPTSFIGSLTSTLFDFFPVLHTRAVSVGKRDNGSGLYSNVNVHEDNNGYVSLAVASGHRTSQLFGRTPVTIRATDLTSDTTLNIIEDDGTVHSSVPSGFALFVVSYNWSCINSSTGSPGRARIEDGGNLVISMGCSEAGGIFGDDSFNSGSGASPDEPLRFTTGVGYNEVAGTVTSDIYMRGYLEII